MATEIQCNRYLRQVFWLIYLVWLIHSQSALAAQTLDRGNLALTFGDEFNQFSWHEVDVDGVQTSGTWATYLGYSWAKPDDLKNRAQLSNHEEALYVDKAFRGAGATPLGIHPFSIKNGILTITATKADGSDALYGYRYTSGMISSQFSFSQRYGVFEIRAKLPKGKGLWPAFWLLPADKSWPPEIDVMEMLGQEPTKFYTTLHSKASGKHTKSDIPAHIFADTSAGFHTYAVDWGPDEIIFYFDDKEIARHPTPPDMHKPFYIIANLGVGGNWPGSPSEDTKFPASYEIDWIRAWKRDCNN